MHAHEYIVYYQQKTSQTWRHTAFLVPVAKNIHWHNGKQPQNCDMSLAKSVLQNYVNL